MPKAAVDKHSNFPSNKCHVDGSSWAAWHWPLNAVTVTTRVQDSPQRQLRLGVRSPLPPHTLRDPWRAWRYTCR